MTLTKTTALGDITVNDSVIAKAIIRSAQTARNKVFLQTSRAGCWEVIPELVLGTCWTIT